LLALIIAESSSEILEAVAMRRGFFLIENSLEEYFLSLFEGD